LSLYISINPGSEKAPREEEPDKTFATPQADPRSEIGSDRRGDIPRRYLSDCYRPEQHYMRGPGPKWAIGRHRDLKRLPSMNIDSFEALRVDFAALAPHAVATRACGII